MIEVDAWPIVEEVAREAGLPIREDCERDLRRFIQGGDQAYQANPKRRPEALANVRRLVEAMVEEARELGLKALHEETFHRARFRVCPIWPFC